MHIDQIGALGLSVGNFLKVQGPTVVKETKY